MSDFRYSRCSSALRDSVRIASMVNRPCSRQRRQADIHRGEIADDFVAHFVETHKRAESPRQQAAAMNAPASVVLPVPGPPVICTVDPRKYPPPNMVSRRSTPVETRSVKIGYFSSGVGGAQRGDHNAVPANHKGEVGFRDAGAAVFDHAELAQGDPLRDLTSQADDTIRHVL